MSTLLVLAMATTLPWLDMEPIEFDRVPGGADVYRVYFKTDPAAPWPERPWVLCPDTAPPSAEKLRCTIPLPRPEPGTCIYFSVTAYRHIGGEGPH